MQIAKVVSISHLHPSPFFSSLYARPGSSCVRQVHGHLPPARAVHLPPDPEVTRVSEEGLLEEEAMVKRRRRGSGGPGPSAVGTPNKRFRAAKEEKNSGKFRFWTDERRFKSSGVGCIVQEALFEAGGVRTGGYPRAAPIPGALGHQRPGDWDFLWSPARLAILASAAMKPGQLVSACPGLKALTSKRQLSITLKEALGEQVAFRIVPRTFTLPDEKGAWQQWLNSQQKHAGASEGMDAEQRKEYPLWILKTAQHLGKGLRLLPAKEAIEEAAMKRAPPLKPYVAVQQYVDDPLLINECKFGVRVWVLVTGFNPLRAYMHTNGLALFSTHSYDKESCVTADGGMGLGHVTNYAQNMDGAVWSLEQLKQHMGSDAYATLWSRISKNSADAISASLKHIKGNHKMLKIPSGGTFELLGLDYLVDANLNPWLLEVNGTPSLAVDHVNATVEDMIYEQKNGMVKDMIHLLDCHNRFTARYTAMKMFPAGLDAALSTVDGSSASLKEKEDQGDEAAEGGEDGEAPVKKAKKGKLAAAVEMDPVKRQKMAKRLKEQLCPTSDAAVMLRAKQELENLGGFQPLMSLFPLGAPREDKTINLSRIPWDPRDYALREMMKMMDSSSQ